MIDVGAVSSTVRRIGHRSKIGPRGERLQLEIAFGMWQEESSMGNVLRWSVFMMSSIIVFLFGLLGRWCRVGVQVLKEQKDKASPLIPNPRSCYYSVPINTSTSGTFRRRAKIRIDMYSILCCNPTLPTPFAPRPQGPTLYLSPVGWAFQSAIVP
jgi:hypothetical protein